MNVTVETVPLDLEQANLVVTDGLHCGVEPVGGRIVDYLDDHPIGGVITRRMYPEAVAAGQRYLSSSELGSKFDPEIWKAKPYAALDIDERAALRFGEDCPIQHWLGIDPHTSNTANSNALAMNGDRVPASVIGVAGVLGLRNVLVLPNYPFFNAFRKFASVETENIPGNPLSDARIWHGHIRTMANRGFEDMEKLGLEILGDLKYYLQYDLMRVDDAGMVDEKACKVIEMLEDIEQPDEYYSPVPLSQLPPFLARLVPEGRMVCSGPWNDNNNSPELPELLGYRKDGKARRACFGSFLLELAPPVIVRKSS